jgi:hypothetical protein
MHCSSLASADIPSSVTTIGDQAFKYCSSLTSIDIPSAATSIGKTAFAFCTGVTRLTFEDSDADLTIGTSAFTYVAPKEIYFGRQMDFSTLSYANAESLELGKNVTSIADGAFTDGEAIRKVTSHNPVPPTSSDADLFSSQTYAEGVLYVPEASIEAYQAANGWKKFTTTKSADVTTALDKIASSDAAPRITSEAGTISVSTDKPVRIITPAGTTVYTGQGDCRVNVAQGIYIVIAGDKSSKVLVK